ncbi:DUF2911 domain-containing protein [Aureisphaera galaxeae]|uniref:DUF2911 domain-containing protein n=1 Tax=Aureisphaera galaxeae TaxID=1538023 RepID=UPI00235064AD|nr:DUF2911 domain-containing protein [Aureisphaera galaxeae]MDC8002496.1 DUF2911 domain-containing protein [Aureisphaera galaxeae]
MKLPCKTLIIVGLFAFLACSNIDAQIGAPLPTPVDLPRKSPMATVSQRVGITDVNIIYSRPSLKGRQFPEEIIQNGRVWRAGANENTIISFSTDVTINGSFLAKGTYGLHMIPDEDNWTIIFSSTATDWGSFAYREDEDALRIKITPQTTNSETEFLTYGFDKITLTEAEIYMQWGQIRIAFAVNIDTHKLVLEGINRDMRSTAGAGWSGRHQAGAYIVAHKLSDHYEDALNWLRTSIANNRNFNNLMTLSELYTLQGDPAKQQKAVADALDVGTSIQLGNYAYDVVMKDKRDKKTMQEAYEILKKAQDKYPEDMVSYANMGIWYRRLPNRSKKETRQAIELYKKAIEIGAEQFPFYANMLQQSVDEMTKEIE